MNANSVVARFSNKPPLAVILCKCFDLQVANEAMEASGSNGHIADDDCRSIPSMQMMCTQSLWALERSVCSRPWRPRRQRALFPVLNSRKNWSPPSCLKSYLKSRTQQISPFAYLTSTWLMLIGNLYSSKLLYEKQRVEVAAIKYQSFMRQLLQWP